tara:strand:+ start:689 stop:1948 length:1260 start_codon:yes stop_codon:yes gene_type:complete
MAKKIGYTANSKKQINLSQVLVVTPPRRIPVDVGKWRSEMKSAEHGYRAGYYDLIDDLTLDAVLASIVDKRIMAITNSIIKFTKDKKEVDQMNEFIDTPEFEFLLKEIMLTKFYGKTVIELFWDKGKFMPYSIPRKHLNTKLKVILKRIYDTEGVSYLEDDWLLNLGSDTDLGIFNRTAVYAIFKRNGAADYGQFCELFGIPQLVGLYDPEDDNGRQEMEEAFKKRGSGGSMTMSKNADVKTLGTDATGNGMVHDKFLRWCDEQLLIAVLGQTMTTQNGSSLSQSKTHAETEDDINQSDRRFVQRILNQDLLPRLEKRGYPVNGGKFEFEEKGENLTAEQQLKIAETVDDRTESGVNEDYWFEKFNLPKGKGKKVDPADPKEPEPADPKKKKKVEKKEVKELAWYKKAFSFFANAPRWK